TSPPHSIVARRCSVTTRLLIRGAMQSSQVVLARAAIARITPLPSSMARIPENTLRTGARRGREDAVVASYVHHPCSML
ncbi:MAG: hypothetical protein M3Y74_21555, partial [Chloroflexota bacterium]|nr:hypothetical protein [Chloroflexota bacterium]